MSRQMLFFHGPTTARTWRGCCPVEYVATGHARRTVPHVDPLPGMEDRHASPEDTPALSTALPAPRAASCRGSGNTKEGVRGVFALARYASSTECYSTHHVCTWRCAVCAMRLEGGSDRCEEVVAENRPCSRARLRRRCKTPAACPGPPAAATNATHARCSAHEAFRAALELSAQRYAYSVEEHAQRGAAWQRTAQAYARRAGSVICDHALPFFSRRDEA